MIYGALGFFACAALLGFYLISYVLTDKQTPKGVAFLHGFFASIGLLILIAYPFIYTPAPIVSLVLFILAAVGGLTLITLDLTGRSLPKGLAIGHGATAVVAFILLISFVFG